MGIHSVGVYKGPEVDVARKGHDRIICMGAPETAGQRGRQPSAAQTHTLRRGVAKWWSIAALWWRSEDRWKARSYAAAAVALSLLSTALLMKISYVQNSFQSALSEKNQDEFLAAVWGFVGVICVAAPLFALSDYADWRLVVEWRGWLAGRLVDAYFADAAYYRLKLGGGPSLDNPDQRICDDVRSFASSSVVLAVGVMRKLFSCVAFGGLLWSIAPRLVLFLLAYAAAGTWVTSTVFGRRLMRLSYAVLRREADLRFALVRVRENAESVAFYRGGSRERRLARGRLEAALATHRSRVAVETWLSLWNNVYSYATILLPPLLMSAKYFAGENEIRFGDIVQVSFAFHRIEGALSYIVTHMAELSGLAAETDRLESLLRALARQHEGGAAGGGGIARRASPPGQPSLALERLTLRVPAGDGGGSRPEGREAAAASGGGAGAGRELCRGLDLALGPGQSLLIVGPSGAGKTSLLRAAAGLWSSGSGAVRAPPPADTFFLPQKPYMPLGTLRQQLIFPDGGGPSPPHSPRRAGRDSAEHDALLAAAAGGGEGRRRDAELEALLRTVCLPDLLARVPGGLGAVLDWQQLLSLGEQQRVAFARLLRARPALAFLDEATSALDAPTEAALYGLLARECPCYVSVGHRPQLAAYHSLVLEGDGAGGWVLRTAEEYRRRLAAAPPPGGGGARPGGAGWQRRAGSAT